MSNSDEDSVPSEINSDMYESDGPLGMEGVEAQEGGEDDLDDEMGESESDESLKEKPKTVIPTPKVYDDDIVDEDGIDTNIET